MYRATVLSVLLYGAETWTIKAESLQRLNAFHNRCVRETGGCLWDGRNDDTPLDDAPPEVAWSPSPYGALSLPKQILYGELDKRRPRHGTRRRWSDVVTADVKAVGTSEDWYEVAQDRQAWQALCWDGISSLVKQHSQGWSSEGVPTNGDTSYVCTYGRPFRRRGDLTRHNRFCTAGGTAPP